MSDQGMRKKVASKAEINAPVSLEDMDVFGDRLKIPPHIRAEIKAKDLVPRFVSIKTLQESGGYHPMGWTPYIIDKPQANPLTGAVESTYRVGDLVLATKPKANHERHKEHLKQKANREANSYKNNVKEMRDRIKDGRADKHISLIEGFEENGDDNE